LVIATKNTLQSSPVGPHGGLLLLLALSAPLWPSWRLAGARKAEFYRAAFAFHHVWGWVIAPSGCSPRFVSILGDNPARAGLSGNRISGACRPDRPDAVFGAKRRKSISTLHGRRWHIRHELLGGG